MEFGLMFCNVLFSSINTEFLAYFRLHYQINILYIHLDAYVESG